MEERIDNLESKLRKGDNDIDNSLKNYVDKKFDSVMAKINRVEILVSTQTEEMSELKKSRTSKQGMEIQSSNDIQKIEAAINEWTKNIENQLNIFKDALDSKIDFKQLSNKLAEESQQRKSADMNSMKILNDIEKKFTELRKEIKIKFDETLKRNNNIEDKNTKFNKPNLKFDKVQNEDLKFYEIIKEDEKFNEDQEEDINMKKTNQRYNKIQNKDLVIEEPKKPIINSNYKSLTKKGNYEELQSTIKNDSPESDEENILCNNEKLKELNSSKKIENDSDPNDDSMELYQNYLKKRAMKIQDEPQPEKEANLLNKPKNSLKSKKIPKNIKEIKRNTQKHEKTTVNRF